MSLEELDLIHAAKDAVIMLNEVYEVLNQAGMGLAPLRTSERYMRIMRSISRAEGK